VESMDISVASFFAPGGPLSRVFREYEERPQQEEMAAAVWEALTGPFHLVVEAGTGVGKSFAYLVPALLFSLREGKTVLVSTNTLTLQDQLIRKDIPVLREALPVPFDVRLLKGRNNYFCLRRAAYAEEHLSAVAEGRKEEEMLREVVRFFRRHGGEGTREELPFVPEPRIWSRVCADSGACRGRKCPYRARCFYQKARNALAKADVIVVNHSLFFSDLAVRLSKGDEARVLPPCRHVIFDEAHTVAETASIHLGTRISNFQVSHLLRALYTPEKEAGILAVHGTEQARRACTAAREAAESFFAYLRRRGEEGDGIWELAPGERMEDPLSPALMRLAGEVAALLRKTSSSTEEEAGDVQAELGWAREKLVEAAEGIRLFLDGDDRSASWVECGGGVSGLGVSLNRVPLDVSDFLRDNLFGDKSSVVMTGATLGVSEEDGYGYFASKVGLDSYRSLRLDSPFDYRRNVTVHLAESMPSPKNASYRREAVEKLKGFLAGCRGGVLLLFTSYTMMEEFHRDLREFCVACGRDVFVQERGSARTRLLEEFRGRGNAVLFATSSFWTGVDVPGEALSTVVITRLPFAVPDHPVIRGKCRLFKEKGKNPFRDFMLPEAVLTFRQGIGRLVRSKTDRGCIVILDSRIIHAWYGVFFRRVLPECEVRYM